jgi:hypothetical protein
LVLATFGGKFALGLSSLIVLQNILRTSCIFPYLTREFLQKHYTPKCTFNSELVRTGASEDRWMVAPG